MKKKIVFLTIVLSLTLSIVACEKSLSNDTTQAEASQEESAPLISTFRDYAWSTSFEEVKHAEITDDMKEYIDYEEIDMDGMIGLSITKGEVAGYETEIGYVFDDGGLIAGGYDPNIDDDTFDEWEQRYTDKYGKPAIKKESIGWGACALWVDNSKNFIFLSELTGISYSKADSLYLDFLNDGLYKYHGIDLVEELNKIGNGGGI